MNHPHQHQRRRRSRTPSLALSLVLVGSIAPAALLTSAANATSGAPGATGTVARPRQRRLPGTAGSTQLTVDGRTVPLDVTGAPEFGWLPQDAAGDETQTAYRIVVTNGLTGASVWDSGKVDSSAESYVPYTGPALADGDEYDWAVTTWNRQGDQSAPARSRFDTGIGDNEWSAAQWIRRPTTGNDTTIGYTLARDQFSLRSQADRVTRALVYIAAPMRWQLHVNGAIVNTQDDYQTAGENYYDVEDVTGLAAAAQRATGAHAGQLAVGVLQADWAVGEAHPEGPQPYKTTLSAGARPGPRPSPSPPRPSARARRRRTGRPRSAAPATTGTRARRSASARPARQRSPPTRSRPSPAPRSRWPSRCPPTSPPAPPSPRRTARPGCSSRSSSTTPTAARTRSGPTEAGWSRRTPPSRTRPRPAQLAGCRRLRRVLQRPDAQALAGWDQAADSYPPSWQPAVVMGTAPLPNPPDCGDYSGQRGTNVAPGPPATATATPVLSSPCGFTHLDPAAGPGDLQDGPPGLGPHAARRARSRPTSATRSSACPWSASPARPPRRRASRSP